MDSIRSSTRGKFRWSSTPSSDEDLWWSDVGPIPRSKHGDSKHHPYAQASDAEPTPQTMDVDTLQQRRVADHCRRLVHQFGDSTQLDLYRKGVDFLLGSTAGSDQMEYMEPLALFRYLQSSPSALKLLCLDIDTERVSIAVSDTAKKTGYLAASFLLKQYSVRRIVEKVQKMVRGFKIGGIVIGKWFGHPEFTSWSKIRGEASMLNNPIEKPFNDYYTKPLSGLEFGQSGQVEQLRQELYMTAEFGHMKYTYWDKVHASTIMRTTHNLWSKLLKPQRELVVKGCPPQYDAGMLLMIMGTMDNLKSLPKLKWEEMADLHLPPCAEMLFMTYLGMMRTAMNSEPS